MIPAAIPKAKYREPKLGQEKRAALAAGDFDFLFRFRTRQHLRIRECAVELGRSESFVSGMIAEGKLETLSPTGRRLNRVTITKRSFLLLAAEQANFSPHDLVPRLVEVAATLTDKAFEEFVGAARKRRAGA